MKKQTKLFSGLIAMLMLFTVFFAQVSAFMAGDIDGDGKVAAADSRLALRTAVGLEYLNSEQLAAADVIIESAEEHIITSMDAREILRMAVGLAGTGSKTVTFSDATSEYAGQIKLLCSKKENTVAVAVVADKLTQLNAYDLKLKFDDSELNFSALDTKNSDMTQFYSKGEGSIVSDSKDNGEIAIAGYFKENFDYTKDYSDIFRGNYEVTDEKVLFYAVFTPVSGELSAYDFSLEGRIYVNEASFVTVDTRCSFAHEEETTEPEEVTTVHSHLFTSKVIAEPGCDTVGEQEFTCACGEVYRGIIPATGHSDEDADGVCDNCGEGEGTGTGTSGNTDRTFLDLLKELFAKIVEFFKNLFNM